MSWERLRFSYDLVAAKYEERFRDELQGKARDRELLESFAGSVGDPIVEIGCGPGQVGMFVRDPSEGQTVRLYVEGQRRGRVT